MEGGRAMAITSRPGAKQGIGAQIQNEVKLHPIATVGVVALVGLGIWALATRNQGTDQTATPSDSFWQGYSTAQEDYLQTLSNAYYSSGSNQASQPAQTPGTTATSSPATGVTETTNSVFTPAYTTDLSSAGTHVAVPSGPIHRFAGTRLPAHVTSHPRHVVTPTTTPRDKGRGKPRRRSAFGGEASGDFGTTKPVLQGVPGR